ncbi:MAG: DUF3592 domain-containing protein [Gemmatimonadales bacterium]
MPGDFLAVFVLGGLPVLLGAEAFRQWRLARTAASWPRVPGRIVSAELEEATFRGRAARAASHRAAITYTYAVAGQEWTSRRVSFGDAFEKGDRARDRLQKYEPNSAVDVFYDPGDPSNAVLEPRAAWSKAATRALVWAGLAVLALAAILISGRGHR